MPRFKRIRPLYNGKTSKYRRLIMTNTRNMTRQMDYRSVEQGDLDLFLDLLRDIRSMYPDHRDVKFEDVEFEADSNYFYYEDFEKYHYHEFSRKPIAKKDLMALLKANRKKRLEAEKLARKNQPKVKKNRDIGYINMEELTLTYSPPRGNGGVAVDVPIVPTGSDADSVAPTPEPAPPINWLNIRPNRGSVVEGDVNALIGTMRAINEARNVSLTSAAQDQPIPDAV